MFKILGFETCPFFNNNIDCTLSIITNDELK